MCITAGHTETTSTCDLEPWLLCHLQDDYVLPASPCVLIPRMYLDVFVDRRIYQYYSHRIRTNANLMNTMRDTM